MTESLDKAIETLEALVKEYVHQPNREGFVLNALRQLDALRHIERITKK